MPITIGGSTDDRIGYMQPTLGGLTVDLDGTYTAPEGRVGSINATLGGLSINFDGVFAASASYDGDMTLTLDGLAMSWRGQFTAFQDFAPQFTSTPSVLFIQGTPDTYDMEAHWTDDGASTVTSFLTPTVSGAGLSYNGNTHILTYDGTDTGSTGSYTLTVQDAVNTVVSASFNVTVQVASASDPLLVTLPTAIDEANYYANEGFTLAPNANEVWFANIADESRFTGGWSSGVNIHGDTEGDDLWMALHQVKRFSSIPAQQALWQSRAQSMRDWMVANLQDNLAGTAGYTADQQGDHLYGWGLAEWYRDNPGDSAALAALNAIRADMAANPNVFLNEVPGVDFPMQQGNAGRRWARWLRFSVALAEVDGQAANITFRDKVIDLLLQDPGYDETYGVSWQGRSSTNDVFDYDSGDRTIILFHNGLFADSLWQAWRVLKDEGDPRAVTCAERIIALAQFWIDLGRNPANGFHGNDSGYNLPSGTGPGDATKLRSTSYGVGRDRNGNGGLPGIYTISIINNLIFAYKFTGITAYWTEAKAIWALWQSICSAAGGDPATVVDHFADMIHQGGTTVMSNNKGELQYVYALFENNGSPARVLSGIKPPWYESATDKTWINMTVAVGAMNFSNSILDPEDGPAALDIGGTDTRQSVISKWNGAAASPNYYGFLCNGGHFASANNALYQFGPFDSETPDWHWWYTDQGAFQKPSDGLNWDMTDSGPNAGTGGASDGYYTDGLPNSRHSYNLSVYVPDLGGGNGRRFLQWGGKGYFGNNSGGSPDAISFHLNSDELGGTYDTQGTFDNAYGASSRNASAYDSGAGRVYAIDVASNWFGWLDMQTGIATQGTGLFSLSGGLTSAAVDPVNRLFCFINGTTLYVYDIDHDNSLGGNDFNNWETYSIGAGHDDGTLLYHANSNAFIQGNAGPTLHKLAVPSNVRNPDGTLNASASWSFETITNGVGGATPSSALDSDYGDGGFYNRLCWIESIDAFAMVPNSGNSNLGSGADNNMYVYKIPEGGL